MKKLIKEHIEMVKVLKESPRKEIIQGAIFLASITALFYYSILIFG